MVDSENSVRLFNDGRLILRFGIYTLDSLTHLHIRRFVVYGVIPVEWKIAAEVVEKRAAEGK